MNMMVAPRPRILESLAAQVKPMKKAERIRIETLGRLNDRHTAALEMLDAQALIELAGEYMLVGRYGGCPRMAAKILAEAEGTKNGKTNG